jgi:tetratricopeptide (TPR) repeat protein
VTGLLPATLAAALATANPAWHACVYGDADVAIAGCLAIVRSDERRPAVLALAHYNRANALSRKAQFERANLPDSRRAEASLARAIRDYSAAIRLDPALAQAWVNRGIAWYDKGDYARAVADAGEAMRLRPGLAEAYNNRALAWHKLGRYDLAQRDFDETIRLEKNYGNALINRAIPSFEPLTGR